MSLERNPYHTKRQPSTDYLQLMQAAEKGKILNQQLQNSMQLQKRHMQVMDETSELLEELIKLQKLQRPKGLTYSFIIPLQASSQLVHLDFITGTKNSANVPATALVNYPSNKLYSIRITNEGPDAILFSLNEMKSSTSATAKLVSNESVNYDYNFPIFETMNIALDVDSVQGSTIRIFGIA